MQLLTIQDLASQLKISPRKIWNLRSTGQMPAAIRVGRSVRWSSEDIDKWISDGCPTYDSLLSQQEGEE